MKFIRAGNTWYNIANVQSFNLSQEDGYKATINYIDGGSCNLILDKEDFLALLNGLNDATVVAGDVNVK